MKDNYQEFWKLFLFRIPKGQLRDKFFIGQIHMLLWYMAALLSFRLTCHSLQSQSARFHYRLLPPLESFLIFHFSTIIETYTFTKAHFLVFGSFFLALCGDTGVELECDFA